MRFAVCGGDLRSVYLLRRLLKDGHTVHCFGLDTADVPKDCHCATLTDALKDAECVILPTPVLAGGLLHAPFAAVSVSAEALTDALPRQIPILGGSIGADFMQRCALRDVHPIDLLSVEALAVKNAALTAMCAVQVMLRELPYSLSEQPVLILGFGRIGTLLGLKLKALGADVTVSSRREEDKAWCAALGLTPADTAALEAHLPRCRLLVNTIPAQVLSRKQLTLLPADATVFELASAPGGFANAPEGLNVIPCGGLPGKYAPLSAADAIAETVYQVLER